MCTCAPTTTLVAKNGELGLRKSRLSPTELPYTCEPSMNAVFSLSCSRINCGPHTGELRVIGRHGNSENLSTGHVQQHTHNTFMLPCIVSINRYIRTQWRIEVTPLTVSLVQLTSASQIVTHKLSPLHHHGTVVRLLLFEGRQYEACYTTWGWTLGACMCLVRKTLIAKLTEWCVATVIVGG